MKKLIVIVLSVLLTGGLFAQNAFKYEIRANGGLRVGGSTFAEIDSITLQAGKLRIMSGATLQKIAGHVLYTDTATMLTKYARKASPTFTGVVKLATDTLATRAYARANGGGDTSIDTTSLSARIDLKAPIASPTFTGTVTGTFSGNVIGDVSGSAGTIANGTTSTGGNVALVSVSNPTTVRYSPNLQYSELIETLSSTNFLAGSLTNGTSYSANGITSVGSASNIDFTITPKGTGVIKKSSTDTIATQAYARQYGGSGTITASDVATQINDSLTARLAVAEEGVAVADTASMLTPYINRTDTASMLSKYLLITDYEPGMSVSDTASMLIPYISCADTAAMLSTYAKLSDLTEGGISLLIAQEEIEDSLNAYTALVEQIFVFGVGTGAPSDTACFNNGRLAGAWHNDSPFTYHVTNITGVLVEGTGTETIDAQISWHTTRGSASATNLNASALTITSTTTGTVDTSFAYADIPPGVWVWCTLSGASKDNKPTALFLTMSGYKTR